MRLTDARGPGSAETLGGKGNAPGLAKRYAVRHVARC
ncbi:hypothetical protein SKA58_02265 [Sphingomonas sp. SKA58]|nr:hypothetical protein SKA58_02265 [Sphingomonas sp. SKA58]